MKTIYIIRHGQTDLNSKGIVQGRGIDSPLNDKGIEQAQAFYNAYKHIKFDQIYVSKLKRTLETVSSFVKDGVPYEALEGLDEISWGIYEGQEQTPEILTGFEALIEKWKSGMLDFAVEGGESPNQLIQRQKEAMDYILNQNDHKTILICMHGRAMRLLLTWLSGLDASEMDQFPHTNTALYVLKYGNQSFVIDDFYNVDHLKLN